MTRDSQALALLQRIIDENPGAGEERWRELFKAEVMADRDLQEAVAKDVFDDILRSKAN